MVDVTLLNGVLSSTSSQNQAVDKSTNKFEMILTSSTVPPGLCFLYQMSFSPWPNQYFSILYIHDSLGIIAKPSNGRESVVTGLCVYTANNNPHADPAQYCI